MEVVNSWIEWNENALQSYKNAIPPLETDGDNMCDEWIQKLETVING